VGCPRHDPLLQRLLLEGATCLTGEEIDGLLEMDTCEACLRIIAATSGVSVGALHAHGGHLTAEERVSHVQQILATDWDSVELPPPSPHHISPRDQVSPRGSVPGVHSRGTLTATVPGQGVRRLKHLASQGYSTDRLAAEAISEARNARQRGRVLQTWGVLEYALPLVREAALLHRERELLIQWLHIGLQDRRSSILSLVMQQISESALPDSEKQAMTLLITAYQSTDEVQAPDPSALGRLQALRFENNELEYLRIGVLAAVASRLERGWAEGLAEAIRAFRVLPESDYTTFAIDQVLGMIAHRRGDLQEALQHRIQASLTAPDRISKLNTKLAAAATAMAIPDLEVATDFAQTALIHAEQAHLIFYQIQAERTLRTIAYQRGENCEPNEDLVALARIVAVPREAAFVGFTEAVFAWRRKQWGPAHRWARCASTSVRSGSLRPLAQSLALVCAPERSVEEALLIAADAIAHTPSSVCIQVLGLLSAGYPSHASEWLVTAQDRAGEVADHDTRRDVLSINESLALLRAAAQG